VPELAHLRIFILRYTKLQMCSLLLLLCPYFAPFVRHSQILVENRSFNLPHLYLAPPLGPLEFRRDFWHQKTRSIAVSCGVKCRR